VKIKLDENVHGDVAAALVALGHDVRTVYEQHLAGRPDTDLARAIKAEGRCLVSFDLDFADPRLFPPSDFAGLVVLRLRHPTARHQIERVTAFFAAEPALNGRLWILEESRARNWTP